MAPRDLPAGRPRIIKLSAVKEPVSTDKAGRLERPQHLGAGTAVPDNHGRCPQSIATLVPGELTFSSGLCGYLHSHAYTITWTYNFKKNP